MLTHNKIKTWYDNRYHQHGSQTMRPLAAYNEILKLLKPENNKILLDISCGTGYLLKTADKEGLTTYGIDISDEATKIAKSNSPNSIIDSGIAENLPYKDNTFNYITCLGSLEHYLDMNKSLQEMQRVAKNDATYCIMVPNINYLFWKIYGSPGTEQHDINENLYSLRQWKSIFKKNNFNIINIHHDKWFAKNIHINSTKNLIRKIVWIFLPLKYTYQFIFILKAKNP